MGWILALFLVLPEPAKPMYIGILFDFAGRVECEEFGAILTVALRDLDPRFRDIRHECRLKV